MLTLEVLEFNNVLLVALGLLFGDNGLGGFDSGETGWVAVDGTVVSALKRVAKVDELTLGDGRLSALVFAEARSW